MYKILSVISMLGLLAGCSNSSQPNTQKVTSPNAQGTISLTTGQLHMMGIEIGSVELRQIPTTIIANGTVMVLPQNRASVTAKSAGRIEEILVHEGQNVKKGQPLFRLAVPGLIDIQQAYLHARADLIFLEKEYERQRVLQAGNAGAAKNLEEVQSKYFRAKSDLHSAESKLTYLGVATDGLVDPDHLRLTPMITVYAPIGGNVTEVPISLGQSLPENAALCQIINAAEHLHAHVELFARDAGSVQEGDQVVLRFADGRHPEVRSKVEYISQELNATTRTVSLHVPIPDGKGIVPGMPLQAIFEHAPVKKCSAPEAAILAEGESFFGFVVEKESEGKVTFRRKPLLAGAPSEGFVPLDTSIHPGTRMALRGAYILEGEMKKGDMQE
jgi:cobalt-zinc-cadmium efflux system membrane fusion protein